MNLLDWLLLVLVLTYALSGYWQGFITGAFATSGLLAGGLIGVWLAPAALGDADPSVLVSLGALFIVILCASLGQAGLQFAGARLRDRITWQPVRAVDAIGGAVLSSVAVLLVAWALGVAISGSGITGITGLVRNSVVLAKVDEALPSEADSALSAFNDVVGSGFFPQYLDPFAPEQIVPVPPGPQRLLRDPDVLDAEASVLKITGTNDCGRGVEGTGFVYADGRVMTNAHVVAGVDGPEVEIDGDAVSAEVVHYDPDVDVAVLALDTSGLPTLALDDEAREGDGVAILGYPQDGPYDVQVGRIRAE
ncbi:MAG: MarP family serine protease, partial [Nocardioides sp.]